MIKYKKINKKIKSVDNIFKIKEYWILLLLFEISL